MTVAVDTRVFTNAIVVLPDAVLKSGSVVARNGTIAQIVEGPWQDASGDDEVVDLEGAYLLPGAIDLHNDSLEFEVNPRPGTDLQLPLALANLERRLAGAGVTTEFHAVAFMESPRVERDVASARKRTLFLNALQQQNGGAIDHFVLHRVDVWHPGALPEIFASLAEAPIRYISLNDHTPGQGQYRDVEKLVEQVTAIQASRGEDGAGEYEILLQRMAERQGDRHTIPTVYRQVAAEVRQRPTLIATHDDDSAEKVELLHGLGARVAEFPVTMEAARRAKELGMPIVLGAPNVVRGGSQSGNLAAHDLIRAGLGDVICADYHAPSLIPAAFRLVSDGVLDLQSAVRMISLNASKAVGLRDRGAIRPGRRADLTVVRTDSDGLPHVEATYRAGEPVFWFATRLAGAVLA